MTRSVEKPASLSDTPSDSDKYSNFIPKFDENGLISAVVTHYSTGEVLMLAWMNEEALYKSIKTGIAYFWSRSRKRLWKKGEESGNLLEIHEMRIDCDQDSVWIKANVLGAGIACHTGARTCFYRRIPLTKDLNEECFPPLLLSD